MERPRRHPGVQEVDEERVLLVCKDKSTGAERVDWWPSEEEARDSNMEILEVRRRVRVEKEKTNWTGLNSLLRIVLGRSGTQDAYTRERPVDQREFFETPDDRRLSRKKLDKDASYAGK
jgi:hypothetical protein